MLLIVSVILYFQEKVCHLFISFDEIINFFVHFIFKISFHLKEDFLLFYFIHLIITIILISLIFNFLIIKVKNLN